jgi:hypothetical protein
VDATHALYFLDILNRNYLLLGEQIDPELMDADTLEELRHRNPPVGPIATATWFGRQGVVISVWSLWEFYSGLYCRGLAISVKHKKMDSHVAWVGRVLAANGVRFAGQEWFVGANALRNLIAHHHCRVRGERAQTLMDLAKRAFPELTVAPNDYVNLETEHVSEFFWRVGEFVRDPSLE